MANQLFQPSNILINMISLILIVFSTAEKAKEKSNSNIEKNAGKKGAGVMLIKITGKKLELLYDNSILF